MIIHIIKAPIKLYAYLLNSIQQYRIVLRTQNGTIVEYRGERNKM